MKVDWKYMTNHFNRESTTHTELYISSGLDELAFDKMQSWRNSKSPFSLPRLWSPTGPILRYLLLQQLGVASFSQI